MYPAEQVASKAVQGVWQVQEDGCTTHVPQAGGQVWSEGSGQVHCAMTDEDQAAITRKSVAWMKPRRGVMALTL